MGGYGPPPKRPEDRARANKPPVAELVLPAEGYTGEIPRWPLPGRVAAADATLWATLWRTPQAAAWARMGAGMARTVARYVALWRSPSDKAPAELRQLEDRLGLNPLAMRRLGWDVSRDELADQRADDDTVSTVDPYAGLRVAPE